MKNQKTLKTSTTIVGIGIHSGQEVTLTCHPAPEGSGIQFCRVDKDSAIVPVSMVACHIEPGLRATCLMTDNLWIKTPEHLLAACYGLGLDNLRVDINQEEVPICDGSALPFVEALGDAGIIELDAPKKEISCNNVIEISEGDAMIRIEPSETLSITYTVEYPDHFIGRQTVSVELGNPDVFINDIAPARTYGFEHEVNELREKGLAKGGSLDNALVIGEKDYINEPRFTDECARHKILDIIGDLAILGGHLSGHITAYKSGHYLNNQLAKKIEKRYR